MTRSILEEFALHSGFQIGIVTKSDLVTRDVNVLRRIAERNQLFVNITITTLDTKLARILEPRAPRPDLRLKAVKELSLAGIKAGVSCAPVVPGITDSPAALDAIVKATKEAGGRYIFGNPLFLKPCSASIFLPFLEKEFPQLVEEYRKRYADKAFVSKVYGKRIADLMASLRKKHGLTREITDRAAISVQRKPQEEQMEMFGR